MRELNCGKSNPEYMLAYFKYIPLIVPHDRLGLLSTEQRYITSLAWLTGCDVVR